MRFLHEPDTTLRSGDFEGAVGLRCAFPCFPMSIRGKELIVRRFPLFFGSFLQ